MNPPPTPTAPPATGRGWKRPALIVLGLLLFGCGLTAATTAWWVKRNLYASPIQPVRLTAPEQQVLDGKLNTLQSPPEKSEDDRRTLTISAKEINAYLARQGLGDRVQVELSRGTLAATMVVPIPQDSGLPLLSGTTLRLRLRLSAAMTASRHPEVQIREVSVGGVPLPNAWLGSLKDVNLVGEHLENDPGLQAFWAGIEELEIQPDGLRVRLSH